MTDQLLGLEGRDLNHLAHDIHNSNVKMGWWSSDQDCIFTKTMLTVSEMSEAMEGVRKKLMDTKLPQYTMEVVEYADAMIRHLDLGGRLDLEYMEHVPAHRYCNGTNSAPKQMLGVVCELTVFITTYEFVLDSDETNHETRLNQLHIAYSRAINSIRLVAQNRFLDLWTVLDKKREFNAVRPDHKPENRTGKVGEKAF